MNISYQDNYIKIETEGGSLTASILGEDSIEYELDGLSESKVNEFYEITKYHDIVLVESLSVDSEYRGQGIATALLKELENVVKEKNYRFMYLNACPILCEDGLDLEELEAFYMKRGFKIFLNQGKNTLMVRDLNG
jgi:GNAT superfamily N-acetyltransferase